MQDVCFPTYNPFTLRDMRALKEPLGRPPPRTLVGRGMLFRPANAASPRPGVVVVEGLGGLKPEREIDYGRRLSEKGFVALVVDSFGACGLGEANHEYWALRVTEAMMLADAFAGLRHLRGRPEVADAPVAVIGFSYGGMISVLCAYEQIARTFALRGERFAAHVSFYGTSAPRLEDSTTTGAPVLMLLGERDANVSVPRSYDIADDLKRGGSAVTVRVLPGVQHQWNGGDSKPRKVYFSLLPSRFRVTREGEVREERLGLPVKRPVSRTLALIAATSYRGYTILGDDEATRLADEEMYRFLAQSLGSPETMETPMSEKPVRPGKAHPGWSDETARSPDDFGEEETASGEHAEAVERRARELWEADGRPAGREHEYRARASRELDQRPSQGG